MKNIYLVIVFWACSSIHLLAQSTEEESTRDQQLENLAEKIDGYVEDDSGQQTLDEWRKNPIDLNSATEEDLESVGLLTDLQIKNFFRYRALLGKLLTIYELQAIPSWNLETIRLIVPFVKIDLDESIPEVFKQRLKGGNHYLLFRVSQELEKSKGFDKHPDSVASGFLGSPQHLFFRYTYNYKNILQYGMVGDKDAGEQFFKGDQRYGFDFYSFHFFMRKAGIIKSLALGDFSVNMGQGLIQWQGLAFTKTASVLSIKRQSPVLRPYHSAGEFNFHRGAGVTLSKGNWEATGFVSIKKVGSNITADTASSENAISSFDNSGYHRTENEIANRNNIRQIVSGASVQFSNRDFHVGSNSVWYHFSKAIQKQDQPYNIYAIRGKSWSDYSFDFSYTFRNFHFFGETAFDKNYNPAFLAGAMVSLSSTMDAAILYRNLNKKYQSLYADAFTENTVPGNEKGFYTGVSIRPLPGWRMDAFFDIYQFPWLKFRVDAPGSGRDCFIKLFYQPAKKWYIYTCFKNDTKEANISGSGLATHPLSMVSKQNWRTELSIAINSQLSFKSRVECIWFDRNKADAEQGFLGFTDVSLHPSRKFYGVNLSLQYFETGGYNSRLYVSEQDVLYSNSLPAFYQKGFRYYIRVDTKVNKLLRLQGTFKPQLRTWLRWAQTIYPGPVLRGNGPDQINDNKTSEIKFQLILSW